MERLCITFAPALASSDLTVTTKALTKLGAAAGLTFGTPAAAQDQNAFAVTTAFADAMEIIPRTLAENAGIDPIDALTELKAAHDKGEKWAGINVFTGKKMDAWKQGVLEPLKIKTQAVSSAAEVAVMILRIDDVITGEKKDAPMPRQGDVSPDLG